MVFFSFWRKKTLHLKHEWFGFNFFLLHTSHLPLVLEYSIQCAPKLPNPKSEDKEYNCLPLLRCKLFFLVLGDTSKVLFLPDLFNTIKPWATDRRY